MSGMTKTPKVHAKPSLMAAVVVYYGSLIAGEPIDLNESENVFHELGVNVSAPYTGCVRIWIMHFLNREFLVH